MQQFGVYNTATNVWTTLSPINPAGQLGVSAAGDLYMLDRGTNMVQRYNPGTDTWTNIMAGPPGGTHDRGNLEIANSGRFFFSRAGSNLLWYSDGGGIWNSQALPAGSYALGDYDPGTNTLVVSQAGRGDLESGSGYARDSHFQQRRFFLNRRDPTLWRDLGRIVVLSVQHHCYDKLRSIESCQSNSGSDSGLSCELSTRFICLPQPMRRLASFM